MTAAEKTAAFCDRLSLLPNSGRVLAAVSGGADSMCMLHLLEGLCKARGLSLAAAHLDHGLRGEDSKADRLFVEAWCKDRGIPCYAGRADVEAYASGHGMGTEEAAREVRYDFLQRTAETIGAACIATAHTADDNAETMVMNLARGAGLRGLCGIPPRRENLIRPILCLTRREVEDYNLANRIPHREDSTNHTDAYTRNRLRHRGMQELEALFPGFSVSALEAALLLREDEEHLMDEARAFLDANLQSDSIPAAALAALPVPVASRAIRSLCPQSLTRRHVEAVLALARGGDPSARLNLPGICVRREYDALCFGEAPKAAGIDPVILEGNFGEVTLPRQNLRVKWEATEENPGIYKSFTTFFFKTTDICGKITLRSRRTGDRLRPHGSDCEKTLQRLMIQHKVPAHRREDIPVLADESGVLGVYGLARSCRAAYQPGVSNLKITFEEIRQDDHAE